MTVPQRYLGSAAIAAWFNVLPETVCKWRRLHADFPIPDVVVTTANGDKPGWHPSRKQEFMEWDRRRAGQGHRSDVYRKRMLRAERIRRMQRNSPSYVDSYA